MVTEITIKTYKLYYLIDSPAPTVNSTLRPEGNACPGDEVIFTCMTLDSDHHTWTGDNYTSDIEIQIWDSLPINQLINISRFPSTSAKLINNSEVNGRQQLVSRLIITVSENDTDHIHSVTCTNMMGDAKTISFQIIEGIIISKFNCRLNLMYIITKS